MKFLLDQTFVRLRHSVYSGHHYLPWSSRNREWFRSISNMVADFLRSPFSEEEEIQDIVGLDVAERGTDPSLSPWLAGAGSMV